MSFSSSARMPLSPKEKAMEAIHNHALLSWSSAYSSLPAEISFTKEVVVEPSGHFLVFTRNAQDMLLAAFVTRRDSLWAHIFKSSFPDL